MTQPNLGNGYQQPNSSTNAYNLHDFIVKRVLGKVRTCTPVIVMAVTTSGQVAPVGFCDCMPLVNQLDGLGNATPHGTIFNLAYVRLFGGKNAVIMDPQVNDIGIAVICDRDISAVKSTGKQSNPGTNRRFDLADGIFIGGLPIGVTPNQYAQFTSTGINIVDVNGNQIQMGPAGITLVPSTGTVFVNGNIGLSGVFLASDGHSTYPHDIKTSGGLVAGFGTGDQVGVQTHTHTQPNDAHGDTEFATNAPTAGT